MVGGELDLQLIHVDRCPGRDLNPHDSFEPGGFKFLEVVFTNPSGDLWGRIIPCGLVGSVPRLLTSPTHVHKSRAQRVHRCDCG